MKRGAKNKYQDMVAPYLEIINKKIREGVTEAEIAKSLNISVATLNNYKQQHPELREALSKNKGADVLQSLVNAGIKAATGYYVENEQIVYSRDSETGEVVIRQVVKNKIWQPANSSLNKFYVQNYGKSEGFSNDPLEYELRKQKAEFDQELAKAENWDKIIK